MNIYKLDFKLKLSSFNFYQINLFKINWNEYKNIIINHWAILPSFLFFLFYFSLKKYSTYYHIFIMPIYFCLLYITVYYNNFHFRSPFDRDTYWRNISTKKFHRIPFLSNYANFKSSQRIPKEIYLSRKSRKKQRG